MLFWNSKRKKSTYLESLSPDFVCIVELNEGEEIGRILDDFIKLKKVHNVLERDDDFLLFIGLLQIDHRVRVIDLVEFGKFSAQVFHDIFLDIIIKFEDLVTF